MDPGTVDVKHDPKVDCYAAQNCKAVDEGPVGGIQRDLTNKRRRREHQSADHSRTCTSSKPPVSYLVWIAESMLPLKIQNNC